jgi:hypothetical protein
MKKTLVAAILGLACTASVMAQGRIRLDSYAGSYPTVSYGAGAGSGLIEAGSGFTVGLYFQLTAGATFSDPSNVGIPGGSWVLGTGTGSTAPFIGQGIFQTVPDFSVPGYVDNTPNPLSQISVVIVAYNGADYASSTIRGHSAAFNITPAVGAAFSTQVGTAMSSFQVFNVAPIPEPSTFALAGLGLASLVIFRRRK